MLEVNLTAQFVLTRELGARMLERGSGKIVFIASLLSFQGGITVPGYAASKGGIAQLTKALANEWAASGVNVNAVAPGYIATDNTQALQDDPVRSAQILQRIPAGRWGDAGRHRRCGAVPRVHCGRLCSRCGAAGRRWMARAMTDWVATSRAVLGHRGVPVVVLREIETAVPGANALAEGGLAVAEVTFRTAVAADAIRAHRRRDECARRGRHGRAAGAGRRRGRSGCRDSSSRPA